MGPEPASRPGNALARSGNSRGSVCDAGAGGQAVIACHRADRTGKRQNGMGPERKVHGMAARQVELARKRAARAQLRQEQREICGPLPPAKESFRTVGLAPGIAVMIGPEHDKALLCQATGQPALAFGRAPVPWDISVTGCRPGASAAPGATDRCAKSPGSAIASAPGDAGYQADQAMGRAAPPSQSVRAGSLNDPVR